MRCPTSKSLLHSNLLPPSYAVYTHSPSRTLISISLPRDSLTVQEAVELSLSAFLAQHCLALPPDPALYHLYAATAQGRRVKEYPPLDGSQELGDTKLTHFYLRSPTRTHSKSTAVKLTSCNTISSGFEMERRPPEKKQPAREFGCFCLRRA